MADQTEPPPPPPGERVRKAKAKTKPAERVRKQQYKLLAAHSFLSSISLNPNEPAAPLPEEPPAVEERTTRLRKGDGTGRRPKRTRQTAGAAGGADNDEDGAAGAASSSSSSSSAMLATPMSGSGSGSGSALDGHLSSSASEQALAASEEEDARAELEQITGATSRSSPRTVAQPQGDAVSRSPLTEGFTLDAPSAAVRSRTNTMDSSDGRAHAARAYAAGAESDEGELEAPVPSEVNLLRDSAWRDSGRKDSAETRPPYIQKLLHVRRLDREHLRHVAYDRMPARMFLSTVRNTMASFPFHVTSVVRHEEERMRRKKKIATPQTDSDILAITGQKNLVVSFQHYFSADNQQDDAARERIAAYENYDPNFLDDPELRTGKHRHVATMPFVRLSIIPFVRPADLRRELNEQFRIRHPDLNPQMSLSKIRRLKQILIDVALAPSLDLEIATVAIAFVLMERLILKNVLIKANRKVLAGVCLMLAAKTNDPQFVMIGDRMNIQSLVSMLEEHLKVSARELYGAEFSAFAALDFHVHEAPEHMLPHFESIITARQFSNVQEYLGPAMYRQFYSGMSTTMR